MWCCGVVVLWCCVVVVLWCCGVVLLWWCLLLLTSRSRGPRFCKALHHHPSLSKRGDSKTVCCCVCECNRSGSGARCILEFLHLAPPTGGMPHICLRHCEPGASKQRAGQGALQRKPRCVWACGTRSGPSNAPPGLQPRSAPVTAAGQRNKTTLDLSNA